LLVVRRRVFVAVDVFVPPVCGGVRGAFVGGLVGDGVVGCAATVDPALCWLAAVACSVSRWKALDSSLRAIATTIFVALCPPAPPDTPHTLWNKAHLGAAAAFFAILAFFSYALFTKKPKSPINWRLQLDWTQRRVKTAGT